MPSFNIDLPHNLGQERAVRSLTGFTDRIREKYQDQVSDLQQSWTQDDQMDFSFKTFGFAISGTIQVSDDRVSLNGSLPIAAVAFRGKIEEEIRSQLAKVLGS